MNASTNPYGLALDNLTDQLVAGAFAMTSRRVHDEMRDIIADMGAVNWNTVSIETILFFHHILGRYADGLYGNKVKTQIMESLELPLIAKFAKAGSVSEEKIHAFHKMYLHTLEQRNHEYSNFELGDVIYDEIAMGSDGTVLSDKERTEKFAGIFISEDDFSEAGSTDVKEKILWQFGERIAELLGEPGSAKVITYIYRYIIAFLFFTLNPVKELSNLKNLLEEHRTI